MEPPLEIVVKAGKYGIKIVTNYKYMAHEFRWSGGNQQYTNVYSNQAIENFGWETVLSDFWDLVTAKVLIPQTLMQGYTPPAGSLVYYQPTISVSEQIHIAKEAAKMSFSEANASKMIDSFMKNVNPTLKKPATYTANSSYKDAFDQAVKLLKDAKTQAEYYQLQKQAAANFKYQQSYPSNANYADKLAALIPDLRKHREQCPFEYNKSSEYSPVRFIDDDISRRRCEEYGTLWSLIQHMNDLHRATRETIADWLDELHDSGVVNLTMTNPNPDRG